MCARPARGEIDNGAEDPAFSAVARFAATAQTGRTSASRLTAYSSSQQTAASLRPTLARRCRARLRRDRRRCGAAPGRGRRRRHATRPNRSARPDSRSCERCQGWGRRGRRMSDVREAAPTLPGIEQRPQAASRQGRSSSRSRRAGGRSTIASLGAAANPGSTDAADGACRPHDTSRPPSRAARPPRRSSPPDGRRTACRPSSGSAPARSDPHGRGVGGARSPTRDQRRSLH